jgi:hypothetical protein
MRYKELRSALLFACALAITACDDADTAGAGGEGASGATASRTSTAANASSTASAASTTAAGTTTGCGEPTGGPGVVIDCVSGTVAHGQSITIVGSGFGTKSPAAPITFNDFEAGSSGAVLDEPGWEVWSVPAGNDPSYSTAQTRGAAGESQSAFQNFVGAYGSSMSLHGLSGLDDLYFHGYYYAAPSGAPTRNTKLLFLSGPDAWGFPEIRFFDMYYPDSAEGNGHNQFGNCTGGYDGLDDDDNWHSGSIYPNEWVRMEAYAHFGTAGQRDGSVWLQRRTETMVDRGPDSPEAVLRSDGCDYEQLLVWSYHADDEGSPTPGLELYWDEIYVDNTQARVELGNASTWTSSTHFEIQLPTAWEESTVTVTVRRGTFAPSSTAYVYLVNRDGTFNEQGFPVTIGE